MYQRQKYGNEKVSCDGITFDSKKQVRRYNEIKLLQRAGQITELELQQSFELVPSCYEAIPTGEYYKKGEKKGQPKYKNVCIEKAVTYRADFTYYENGQLVVEDTKGMKTKEYIIKRKLMLYIHGIKIKEI